VSSSATPANPAPDQEAADDRFENVRAGDDAKERAIFVMSHVDRGVAQHRDRVARVDEFRNDRNYG